MAKIIHILHHAQPRTAEGGLEHGGWHEQVARQLAKAGKDELEALSFGNIDQPREDEIDGVVCKQFPATFSITYGAEYSKQMIDYLREEAKDKETVFHIHGMPSLMTYRMASILRANALVVQDHGGRPTSLSPFWNFAGRRMLRGVDFYFVLTEMRSRYIVEKVGIDPSHVAVQTMGIDVDSLKPMNKNECRANLGLPESPSLVLYVGTFDEFKGLPKIIDAVRALQKKYDVDLVAVGGRPGEKLYSHVKEKVKLSFEWQPTDSMRYFYNSCETLAWYLKDPRWGGTGVSVMEAMACNRCVVSNTLQYGPLAEEVISGCFTLQNEDEFLSKLEEGILTQAPRTREFAVAHFSWAPIISNTRAVYRSIFK
ncbi:MAG: glycosyltransferase family 4 protein [Thaumarchaeota archaeon]|nr:glycosyltransferase family 4 protein [Nitrososphaerota archaeon]